MPTDASTIPRSVVGSRHHGIPRRQHAHANPAVSVSTPPPTASTGSERTQRVDALEFIEHVREGGESLLVLVRRRRDRLEAEAHLSRPTCETRGGVWVG